MRRPFLSVRYFTFVAEILVFLTHFRMNVGCVCKASVVIVFHYSISIINVWSFDTLSSFSDGQRLCCNQIFELIRKLCPLWCWFVISWICFNTKVLDQSETRLFWFEQIQVISCGTFHIAHLPLRMVERIDFQQLNGYWLFEFYPCKLIQW